MNKIYFLLIITLLPSYFLAQKYAPIQIEFGMGVMSTFEADLAATIPLSLELKTQRGVFDFSLQYKRSVVALGVDHPTSRKLLGGKQLFATLSSNESDYLNRLQEWEAYQMWIDVHAKVGYFNPVVGFGLSINQFKGFIKKERLSSSAGVGINSYVVSPFYSPSFNIRLGHKFRNLRFYMESQVYRSSSFPIIIYFGTAVNFGLTSERKKEVVFYKLPEREKRFASLLFRIELTGGYLFFLSKKRDASSFLGGIDIQYKMKNNHFVGMAAIIGSQNNGYDSDTQEIKPDFIVTNASQQLRAYTIYYRYNKQLNISKALFFGGGLGRYKIPIALPRSLENYTTGKRLVKLTAENGFGANGHIGIRSNLISHTLTLHYLNIFPSPYPSKLKEGRFLVEYKVGVGLSFHK